MYRLYSFFELLQEYWERYVPPREFWRRFVVIAAAAVAGMMIGIIIIAPQSGGGMLVEEGAMVRMLKPAALRVFVGQDDAIALPDENQSIVASRKGSVYYTASCSGATRIAEKNKIFFASIAEAEQEGYRPAKNCDF